MPEGDTICRAARARRLQATASEQLRANVGNVERAFGGRGTYWCPACRPAPGP